MSEFPIDPQPDNKHEHDDATLHHEHEHDEQAASASIDEQDHTRDITKQLEAVTQEIQTHYRHALANMLPCLDAQTALYSNMQDMLSGVTINNEFINNKAFHQLFTNTIDGLIDNILFVTKRAIKMLYVLDEAVTSLSSIERSVSSIRSISHKTNILAINASIEASKAGEAGAGFNIVANEVRNVSEQIKDITQQINRNLQSVGHVVTSGMEIIEEIGHADMSDNILARDKLDVMLHALMDQNKSMQSLLASTEANHIQLKSSHHNLYIYRHITQEPVLSAPANDMTGTTPLPPTEHQLT